MKKLLVPCIIVLLTVTLFSCQPYGKRVKINDHLEVYTKKEATDAEAKKLGEYFESLGNDKTTEKSLQLEKENDVYTVRMVIPDEALNNKELEESFQALQYLIKENVFNGKTVKLILADDKFNDKRVVAELSNPPAEAPAPIDSSAQQAIDTTSH